MDADSPARRLIPDHDTSRRAANGGPALDTLAEAVTLALGNGGPHRLHALVPTVSQPIVANAAAALLTDVSMTEDADEVAPMAARSDAILVNLGMLHAERRAASLAAVASGRPFVLDPVKVDRVPQRLAFARELLAYRPAVVKGNAAEMAALGELPDDVVAVTTGKLDRVRLGRHEVSLHNGDPLLPRVIGTGCAAGMLIARQLALGTEPFAAALAGLAHLNIAAEHAGERARRHGGGGYPRPGTFAVALLDALHDVASGMVGELRLAPPPLDVSLYLVMGPDVADPVGLASEAVAGGVSLVQWRDKSGSTAKQVAAARLLSERLPVPVIINDRADVAAVSARGVHVGHGDLTGSEARQIMPFGRAVGLTVHTTTEASAARASGAYHDYVSIGGVFATTSKHNPHPPIGVDGFVAILRTLMTRPAGPTDDLLKLPVCAVAGIDAERAQQVVEAGADGVAVMSAITKARDPRAAAAKLREAVEEAKPRRLPREAFRPPDDHVDDDRDRHGVDRDAVDRHGVDRRGMDRHGVDRDGGSGRR